MGLVEDLLDWSKEIFMPMGEAGLFIISFVESSVFPVPPDVVLIPLTLFNPSLALYYAMISTAGSVLGGIAGYYIGLKGGRPLARRLFSESKLKRVEDYFAEYGAWAVLIAAFTPIPYKVFTIASGIVRLDMKRFVVASIVGRGARFFAEAVVLMLWGERLLEFILGNFEVVTFAVAGAIIVVIIIQRKMRKKRS